MNRVFDGSLKRWNSRQRGVELRPGAGRVQLGSESGFEFGYCDICRFALVVGVLFGDVELMLRATQFEIIAGHLRDEGNQDILAIGLGGSNLGAGCLNGAAHAAKDIEFPGGIETEVEQLQLTLLAVQREWRGIGAGEGFCIAGVPGDDWQCV